MSIATKQNFWGVVCLVSAVFMVFCIWRMIPYGLAGEASKVKLYFALMIPAFVLSLVAATAYYYYRHKLRNSDLERIRAEVNALSQAGTKIY